MPRAPASLAAAAIGGLALAGCSLSAGSECVLDRDCGSDVCARDGLCHPPSQVRAVAVRWTVTGQTASEANCAGHPDLFLRFDGDDPGDRIGYSPVPCFIGLYNMDKLPTRYQSVELGIEGGGFSQVGAIGRDNSVKFDLVP